MASATPFTTDRRECADRLAMLIQRRAELLPAADDAYVLSELTSIEQQIRASQTDRPVPGLAA